MRKENGEYTYKWKPNEEGAPILKITKSSLGTFGFCPASYKYSYLDDIKQRTNEAMIKGTIIHNAEEQFWKSMDIEKANEHTSSPLMLASHMRSLYPETDKEDYEDIYLNMSAFWAERFLDAVQEDTTSEFIPVGNELKLDARFVIDDIEVHLQGIIDRIYLVDGSYVPLELKTGVWKDTSGKKTSMRKEMAFYKLLFEESSDEQKIEAGLDPNIPMDKWGWFFPASNYVWVEDAGKRSFAGMLNSVRKLINAYLEDSFDFAFFYKKCIHCGHYDHCDAVGETTYDW